MSVDEVVGICAVGLGSRNCFQYAGCKLGLISSAATRHPACAPPVGCVNGLPTWVNRNHAVDKDRSPLAGGVAQAQHAPVVASPHVHAATFTDGS